MKNIQKCNEVFNGAVARFFELARNNEDGLADAADRVFLARDKMSNLRPDQWDRVIEDMELVSKVLHDRGIAMMPSSHRTSTGKETYKILNRPSRFDA